MSTGWTSDLLNPFADPVSCVITCCCPCVQYGLNATAVHGGSCPQHGITYCLTACFGLQGLFAGKTRKAIRDAHDLPQVPTGLGDRGKGESDPSDFLVHTLGILCCFALCQEAREIKAAALCPLVQARSITSPLTATPSPFTAQASLQTSAPKQETMT